MRCKWLRIGDYFNSEDVESAQHHDWDNATIITNYVSFTPDSIKPVILRLDLYNCFNKSKGLHIRLIFSPFYYSELSSYCNTHGIPYRSEDFISYGRWGLSKSLQAETYATIPALLDKNYYAKLLRLFDYFNARIEPQPFSRELITEIRNIYFSGMQKLFVPKHIIPPMPLALFEDTRNKHSSRRPDYDGLADILHFEQNPKIYKKFLIEGDNPDERTMCGHYSPIMRAILEQESLEPLELLLWYGANPFKRLYSQLNLTQKRAPAISPLPAFFPNSGLIYLLSPIELALAFKQTDKANVIVNEFSRIINSAPLSQYNSTKINVVNTQIQYSDSTIFSYFLLNNNKQIRTEMKCVEKMTELEKQAVYHLFSQNFSASSDQLIEIFNKDFSHNKLIDIIYDADQIIGFNLSEIICPRNNKKTLILHCAYGALAPEYRGYGLMVFLTFRLAYILQALLPEKHIGVFFCAAHYNSYRMVNFQHTPKYQSSAMQNIVQDTINDIFGSGNVMYHHKELTSYIIDNVSVKSSINKERTTLNEQIYNREILGYDASTKNECRSAPVMYFVGNENYNYIRKAANNLGINFDLHVNEFANELKKLIPLLDSGDVSLKALTKSSSAFFKMNLNYFKSDDERCLEGFKAKL